LVVFNTREVAGSINGEGPDPRASGRLSLKSTHDFSLAKMVGVASGRKKALPGFELHF
jgi:hypothetical protein